MLKNSLLDEEEEDGDNNGTSPIAIGTSEDKGPSKKSDDAEEDITPMI